MDSSSYSDNPTWQKAKMYLQKAGEFVPWWGNLVIYLTLFISIIALLIMGASGPSGTVQKLVRALPQLQGGNPISSSSPMAAATRSIKQAAITRAENDAMGIDRPGMGVSGLSMGGSSLYPPTNSLY